MADIGSLTLEATIDTRDYETGAGRIKAANGDIAKSSQNAASSASKSGSSFSDTWGGFAKISRIAAGAVVTGAGAMGGAIVGIGKQAVEAYSDYQQATGGVETLFKNSAAQVERYASEAYKTAGVSANDYMDQVTSFAATLVSSLGGDTKKAAELGNQAIIDMSDNANKMGTDVKSIQMTYQSLARGNYAMLDNLKLGYGGTKSEMQRMIDDANKLEKAAGRAGDLSIDKFSDVVTAIHDVQTNLGITGTTAKEASTTISGSIGQMKSSWTNLLTAIGGGGNVNEAVQKFVSSFGNVAKNLLPVIQQAGVTIVKELPSVFKQIGDSLPSMVSSLGGPVFESLGSLLDTTFTMVDKAIPFLTSMISGVLSTLSGLFGFVSRNSGWILPLVAGIVGLSAVVQGIIVAQKAWTAAVTTWQAVQKVGTAIQWAFNAAMSANPIMLVVLAIAALVTALVLFFTKTELGQKLWGEFTSFMSDAWNNVVEFFETSIDNIGGFFSGLFNWIKTAFSAVVNFIKSNVGIIVAFVLGGPIVGMFTALYQKNQAFRDFINGIVSSIIGFFRAVPGKITGFFHDAASRVRNMWNGVVGFFRGIPGRIAGFFSGIGSAIAAPFKAAFNAIKSLWNSTVGGVGFTVPNWIPGVGGKSFSIPRMAHGGTVLTSGMVMVGEQGPELLTLPAGAQITPHRDVANVTPSQIVVENMTVRSANDIRLIAQQLYRLQQRDGRRA